MKMPFKWEFPGGKINPGESPEACLQRELLEELALTVYIKLALPPTTHDYPNMRVTLYPYVCAIQEGEPKLNEHAALKWLSPKALGTLDWAEADLPVIDAYRHWLEKSSQ